ncbi:methyltransferase family protein [Parasphingopyxis lamellibrachiae]|uniref:Protein-S-isoprenylcysteine O-methyltransferase Ste14 n=1 Tax=Parasphingopyxis lamellibrachiae TaxID=680125 RepID=A0A3D9FEK0_9SPHN|nr:isoprenylcysteine carboxylmethyltransferase family protein [Parasphingopyxis lamellibrachiae]RED16265.1 protein-S-isoprenylcysteine O-methyltransferase Ste14 [Parasphingopyxis lamellibrachiae]
MNVHRDIAPSAGAAHADPRPPSAVSSGVGFAGLFGLLTAIVVGRMTGANGPVSSMLAVIACGLPMVLWTVFVDRAWKNESTGLDWSRSLKSHDETREISIAKLAGLWATWAIIAAIYCIARYYWDGQYLFAMRMLAWSAPVLFFVSIPYIFWIDRRLREPKDGAYMLGAWLMGERAGIDREKLVGHFRSWAVKGFFTAFMISIVPGNWFEVLSWTNAQITSDPVAMSRFLIGFLFLVDVAFATVGYVLTLRPLDAHIRSANPYAQGWVAALICYPPFILMSPGGPLDYSQNTADWSYWLQGAPAVMLGIYGGVLVLLTAIYSWATVAFGIRFSNLTHRGILTHGPYRWTRHPAYVSKNLFWWLATLPFIVTSGNPVDMIRNTVILGLVSGVYYWRAKTEERHLMADSAYRDYFDWMERNAPVPRLFAWATGRQSKPGEMVPTG